MVILRLEILTAGSQTLVMEPEHSKDHLIYLSARCGTICMPVKSLGKTGMLTQWLI